MSRTAVKFLTKIRCNQLPSDATLLVKLVPTVCNLFSQGIHLVKRGHYIPHQPRSVVERDIEGLAY